MINHKNITKNFQLYFEEPPSTNRNLHIDKNHIKELFSQAGSLKEHIKWIELKSYRTLMNYLKYRTVQNWRL